MMYCAVQVSDDPSTYVIGCQVQNTLSGRSQLKCGYIATWNRSLHICRCTFECTTSSVTKLLSMVTCCRGARHR